MSKRGQRVKIILSRTHPDFVRRLFELEIPEIADNVISIRALAREAGYRSKVAVSSADTKVDAVGACVGVRGTRIKNIVDELGGERIDIVRWNESLQVLIPNSLQPAEIEEVMLCHLLGRAIVLVREDQLSLAIGRRGQNVRLASKLVGWDIEIMTGDELDKLIDKAVRILCTIDGLEAELAERMVEQGILSYDDLSIMDANDLSNTIEGLSLDTAQEFIDRAEELAEEEQEESPRRKGGRLAASENLDGPGSASSELTQEPLDGESSEEPGEDGEFSPDEESTTDQDPVHDLALAEEGLETEDHEISRAPSEIDQDETERLMLEAIEGISDEESESSEQPK